MTAKTSQLLPLTLATPQLVLHKFRFRKPEVLYEIQQSRSSHKVLGTCADSSKGVTEMLNPSRVGSQGQGQKDLLDILRALQL